MGVGNRSQMFIGERFAGLDREAKFNNSLQPRPLVRRTGCLQCAPIPRNDARTCGATCRAASPGLDQIYLPGLPPSRILIFCDRLTLRTNGFFCWLA